jgi:hypothetical protein
MFKEIREGKKSVEWRKARRNEDDHVRVKTRTQERGYGHKSEQEEGVRVASDASATSRSPGELKRRRLCALITPHIIGYTLRPHAWTLFSI